VNAQRRPNRVSNARTRGRADLGGAASRKRRRRSRRIVADDDRIRRRARKAGFGEQRRRLRLRGDRDQIRQRTRARGPRRPDDDVDGPRPCSSADSSVAGPSRSFASAGSGSIGSAAGFDIPAVA